MTLETAMRGPLEHPLLLLHHQARLLVCYLDKVTSGDLMGSAFGFGPGDPRPISNLCVTFVFAIVAIGFRLSMKEAKPQKTNLMA